MRFEQLHNLHWLWGVAALALIAALTLQGHRRRLLRFATANLLSHVGAQASVARRVVKTVLVLGALVALVAAMIDPRWGVTWEEVQQRGVDVMVVLDVSRSMDAEDASPSRLESGRQAIHDLVAAMNGDRVGLVAVAGTAAVRCPLTVDYGAFRLSLDEVDTQSAARGGSLLGDAIRVAVEAFPDDVPDSKAIVVLSDGEDHGSYPIEAARSAYEEHGARVFTVGIGDPIEGARIPEVVGGRRQWLVHEGQEVWSKMDESTLRDMALAGGGAYIPAGTRRVDMARIHEERIAPMSTRDFDSTRVRRYHPRYQWFAALALALLAADGLIGTRRPHVREEAA